MNKTNLATIFISILASLVLIEIGLRLMGISYPEFNQLDFRYGWSPRPGIHGTYAGESRTIMKINRAGFRDSDHVVEKPAGVLRIAVLGDSFTEAREVALEDTFWKVMESKLAPCLKAKDIRPEVLSFGVNGYGTAQELLVLQEKVWQYDPDVVVLAFFTGNDIWNNSRQLDGHKDRPYFTLEDGSLVLDDSNGKTFRFMAKKYWADIKHGLFNSLRFIQVARQAYVKAKTKRRHKDVSATEQLNAGLNPDLYLPPETPAWQDGWAVSEEMIREMSRLSKSHGAEFWLVTLSNPVQIFPDRTMRESAARSIGTIDLLYPDRRLREMAKKEEIPVITLAETLGEYALENDVQLHGNEVIIGGHWNMLGHRIGGEIIAKSLCAALQ